MKVLFLNVGWMKNYKGLFKDKIEGGGAFVKEHGYGHEIFNFQPLNNHVYGYVQAKDSININRLGAKDRDDYIDDILVVWVSKHPEGGVYVVGWYKNATVFRYYQEPLLNTNRVYKGEHFGYFVKATAEDATLLEVDERTYKIPRGKGGMGQSNVWYADKEEHRQFKERVLEYILNDSNHHINSNNKKNNQADPFKRKKIENVAVEKTVTHYKELGYQVDSVEKDNVGWDLEATMDKKLLRIEVKGLSGSDISFELTPNEYEKMKLYKNNYRIAVVTKCLEQQPLLHIFSYSPDNDKWEDNSGNVLSVHERISARINTF